MTSILPFSAHFAEPPDLFRILLVEDEERLRGIICELIRAPRRELVECGTGFEAIEALRTQHIDLILLDIKLPDMTGVDVMNWIQQNGSGVSVIVISGDESIESAIAALRCGAHEFVRKPFEPAALIRTVENALTARKLRSENSLIKARLEQSESLHRYFIENSPDLIFALDPNGCFWFVNDRFESLLGYSKEELIGTHYSVLVHPDDLKRAYWALNERRTGSRASSNVEIRLRKHEGTKGATSPPPFATVVISTMGIYLSSMNQLLAQPRCPIGTYGVARDISERKQAEQIINFHVTHDELTGLPNRSLFLDRLRQAIAHGRRRNEHLAVIFIDLDRFKLVNDTYGHVKGDHLLQQVAARLRRCLRDSDTLSRIGGDEFVAVISDIDGRADAEAVAKKILIELRHPFRLGEIDFRTSVSIGVAMYPEDGSSDSALIRNADLAMYQVKRKGKDGIKFFAPDMSVDYGQQLELENELRIAIESGKVDVYYQPIHNIDAQCVEALEALVRWNHPVHGLLTPEQFIPVAEESGLIFALDEYVLETACADLRKWQLQGFGDLRVAVNLSAREFDRPDLEDRVINTVRHHDLPPDSLELEITESVFIEDIDAVAIRARTLRSFGIRISIDDFGTCYSSFGYLQSLPISGIKIDQLFVRNLGVRRSSESIVSALIGIARGCGLGLVAEGVEQFEQIESLRVLGCSLMQGHFFSHPLPASQVRDYLARVALPNRAILHDGIGIYK